MSVRPTLTNEEYSLIAGFPNITAARKPDPITVRHDDFHGAAGTVVGEGSELFKGYFGELRKCGSFFVVSALLIDLVIP